MCFFIHNPAPEDLNGLLQTQRLPGGRGNLTIGLAGAKKATGQRANRGSGLPASSNRSSRGSSSSGRGGSELQKVLKDLSAARKRAVMISKWSETYILSSSKDNHSKSYFRCKQMHCRQLPSFKFQCISTLPRLKQLLKQSRK